MTTARPHGGAAERPSGGAGPASAQVSTEQTSQVLVPAAYFHLLALWEESFLSEAEKEPSEKGCTTAAHSARDLSQRRASVSEPPHGHGPPGVHRSHTPGAAPNPQGGSVFQNRTGGRRRVHPTGEAAAVFSRQRACLPGEQPRTLPRSRASDALPYKRHRDQDTPGRRSGHRGQRPTGLWWIFSLASLSVQTDVILSQRFSVFLIARPRTDRL